MKNINTKFLFIIFVALSFPGCDYDEDEILQGYEEAALPVVSDITSSFFDLLDLENANVAFTLDKIGVPTNSISIQKTYDGKTVIHEEVTVFPSQLNISISEAISGFQGVTLDDLEVGEVISFSFLVNTADGRTFRSGVSVDAALSCESDLAGTYSYATTVTSVGDGGAIGGCSSPVTGTGTLTSLGAGSYSVSDASFGQYGCAWADSPATGVVLNDVCNQISTSGSDQYGLLYTFNILSNDGTNLEIMWENDYGDKGTTILTRTDSKSWPEGLSN